ncbi:phycobilisome rod-core linker polypeptide [Leptolyngbya sp. 7M]|uniref:phycobilisome rod-core linker polypeptide n=1 Tax=Leptolyngbya sp. 7M TaxID=2812896 RepID=UPI001B8D7DB8|nr:phycobilisome rod-core linker polypeptide [Leptolyngbya sp. 7M]QYO66413.1 phycobilisome rod-core linker polypeptide [Leptolyngbya sp. 7M]
MALWVMASEPVELRPAASEAELQTVIRAVYRQVLGNRHLMESQRLTEAESLLRQGELTVRGFVRQVAQSDLYRSLFFEPSSPYRFIELNFKHLLGRAPIDQTEIAEHVQRYVCDGYAAEIDSYLDSNEYQRSFGEHQVPYERGSQTQAGLKAVAFNRSLALMRGFAASDSGRSAQLITDLAANLPTPILAPTGAGAYTNSNKRFRLTIAAANLGPRTNRSRFTVEVNYEQLSSKIQSIHRTGGKIVRISEVT